MKRTVFYIVCVMLFAGCQHQTTQKVFGRYVPERKDDFAWENEYAAFRLYGPALAPENPSNGVDLWLKASPELVVDSFYYRELVQGFSYHVNYGKGLDCYKVAHTAGCGGVVIITDSTLWTGGPYSRYEVLEQTPDRLVFRLTYDSIPVAGQIGHQTLTVTAEAGQLLNKAEVVLTLDNDPATEIYMGGGIYLHEAVDNCYIDTRTGVSAYAEPAISDPTSAQLNYAYNGVTSLGRAYSAVRTPEATMQQVIEGTLVSVRPYQPGDTLTYWFGGCWSEWSDSGKAFPTDTDWFDAVTREAR